MARSDGPAIARTEHARRGVRRAYELAHVAAGLRGVALAATLALIAIGLYRVEPVTWLVAGTLAVSLGVLAWRGGAWRRGAFAGVIAGLPPLIIPSIVFALSSSGGGGHCASCETVSTLPCIAACFGSGSLVGIAVGMRAIAESSPRRFAAGAITTAALAGMLGCGTFGLGGALGVSIGLVGGGVAGWLLAARTARA